MTTLNDMPAHACAKIAWIINQTGREILEFCRMKEDDPVTMTVNEGMGVIIRANGRSFAMDRESAERIRINLSDQ